MHSISPRGTSAIYTVGSAGLRLKFWPSHDEDATTAEFVRREDGFRVSKNGDTKAGALAMDGNAITGLANPSGIKMRLRSRMWTPTPLLPIVWQHRCAAQLYSGNNS